MRNKKAGQRLGHIGITNLPEAHLSQPPQQPEESYTGLDVGSLMISSDAVLVLGVDGLEESDGV